MSKGIGRQLSHEVLEQYRFRAIELRRKHWKIGKIAEAFGVNRRAVTRWFTTYRLEGKKGLKSRKAKGPDRKLCAEDSKKLLACLKRPATKFGFETPLWTCKRVGIIVRQKTHQKIDTSNIWRWLRSWNMTPQRPEKLALEADEKEQRKWLREEWPKIKAHARRWQAVLYFLDECGVSLTPVIGTTWSKKGKTPTVRVTGNKGSICVSSVISPAGRLLFRIEKDTIDSEVFIGFLKQIMNHHKSRKIIIVLDRARPHTAKDTMDFMKGNKKRLAVYYLPSYSPKLNPDEHVWNHLKNQKLKTHQARTKKELKQITRASMQSIQRSPYLIKSFFYVLNEL